MRTEQQTTRIVRSWLEGGVTALPDRVLDAVLDRVPATPQRRSWWPWRRIAATRRLAPLATVAVTILVMLIGSNLLPVVGPGGESTAQPSPTASPRQTDIPTESSITPGRQSLDDFPVGITFDVPAGWIWCSVTPVEQGVCRALSGGGSWVEVHFLIVANVAADPCRDVLLSPPPGPSVDDLVTAISNLAYFTATPAIDVTVDGFAGKEFTVTAPRTGCELFTWATADRTNGVGLGEENLIRVVDVDGTRVVMTGAYSPTQRDPARAAIEQIMGSVAFISRPFDEPGGSSPSN